MRSTRTRGRRAWQGIVALALATASAVALTGTASATRGDARHSDRALISLQERYFGWLAGSDTNPLLQENFCGEMVGRFFFFNAAGVPDYEAECRIPAGTPMVASPGGVIVWEPTDGNTTDELLTLRDEFAASIGNPSVTLDGKALRFRPQLTKTGVYRIRVGEQSLIKTTDPIFPPEWRSTRVASAGWIVPIHPLPPGRHTLIVSDTIDGEVYTGTFHIVVVRRHWHR